MSSTNDSPALDLSSVSIEEADNNEIELSLDLSIGSGLRKSTEFQNSMEFVENSSSELTNVPVIIPNKADTNLVGDLTGNNEVQMQRRRREAKRKREEMLDEPQMIQCRVSETKIGVPEPNLARTSSEMSIGSIERKSFKDGETISQNNETCYLKPVVLRSFSLNQSNRNLGELVTGTASSGKDSQETIIVISPADSTSVISPAENTSVISPADNTSVISPDIKPSVCQEADSSKVETVIDPIPRQPMGDENKAKNHTEQTNPLDTKPSNEEPNSTSSRQVFKPPQMPYVSTTGNGPNGRRATGFLYKYTNTEVSIVCVCHGSSFTPAEFVEHAGGINISHPLRHIMVIPSAFDDFTN